MDLEIKYSHVQNEDLFKVSFKTEDDFFNTKCLNNFFSFAFTTKEETIDKLNEIILTNPSDRNSLYIVFKREDIGNVDFVVEEIKKILTKRICRENLLEKFFKEKTENMTI